MTTGTPSDCVATPARGVVAAAGLAVTLDTVACVKHTW